MCEQTKVQFRWPHLLIVDKGEKNCQMIDVAIPEDCGERAIEEKEKVE